MADKALNLYRAETATPVETWVTLFTTNPTADHPTAHGAIEWGPGRVRVYPNSSLGSPHWSEPADFTNRVRVIRNVGSVLWSNVALTVSPATVIGVGVFDAETNGNLLTWDEIDPHVVSDGESRTIGTAELLIKGD
jgi:hypothetical protein